LDRKDSSKKIIDKAQGRSALTEFESKQILTLYGIPVSKHEMATSAGDAVKAAEKIGYPVVLKVVSPEIIHKTDVGGVKLNLSSDVQVKEAYNEMMNTLRSKKIEAKVQGVLVEEMAEKGQEVIVGMKRDPTFGPVILFGLGGVFVEILKDVSLRVVPLTRNDALEMMGEIKGYPLLKGYRGQPPSDVESVVEIVLKAGQIAQDLEAISDIDLNPVFVQEAGKGSIVVDAKMLLRKK